MAPAAIRERTGPVRTRSEISLVRAAQAGGPAEREELVESFLPLIGSVARVYRKSTRVTRDELMQEGVVGLLRALQRYDCRRGIPFWAYASWWVRQAMQQVVSELSGPLVLSDRALRQLARIRAAQGRIEQAQGRPASASELAAAVDLPRDQVASLISAERRPRSLEESEGEEKRDAASVGDQLRDPAAEDAYDRACNRVCASQLPSLLDELNERERAVICSRYGIGHREQTLSEVAGRLGVSAERVRQIEHTSLTKLCAAADLS